MQQPMTFEELSGYMKRAGCARIATTAEKAYIAEALPLFIKTIDAKTVPEAFELPTGEKITSGTRMTAVRCHCLLLARLAFGLSFHKASAVYEELSKDILFGVMREHFNKGELKGLFCCATCCLSLLPLYAHDAFRFTDCTVLYDNVIAAYERKALHFRSSYPPRYAEWALAACKI